MKTKNLLFISIALFIFQFLANNSFSQVPTIERDALIALYDSTGGENWTNNTNWDTTEPVSDWYGVNVINDHVTSLSLSFNNMSGTVPDEISNLSELITLNIRNNDLSGEVLDQLIQLTELVSVNLSFNDFLGQVPSEISDLSNLQTFVLSANNFSGELPIELGELTNLYELYLANNAFSGDLPDELDQLTNLNEFWISGNEFTGSIPTSFNNFPLDIFRINDNLFDDLPFLGDVFDATTIGSAIYGNNFEFDDLELNEAYLDGDVDYSPMNPISATENIYVTLGQDLSYTLEVGGANNVYQWYKDGESITGQESDELVLVAISDADTGSYHLEITNTLITDLTLSSTPINIGYQSFFNGVSEEEYNALVALYDSTDGPNWTDNTNWLSTEPVSDWFGVTVVDGHVSQLLLNYNNLNGSLVTDIGDLTYLTSLKITNNPLLNGEIPEEIGNITGLTELNFSGNALTGSIPEGIGNSPALWYLRMGANELEDSIPASIWELSELTYLDLNSNNLVGNIPSEVSNLTNLSIFNLSFNQISGAIPNEIGELTELTSLRLTANSINGILPTELGDLSNLTQLGVGNNELTGEIPSSLGDLSELINLNLSSNQLSGNIPIEIWGLENLFNLVLEWNQLEGSLPSAIEGLGDIEQLWLGSNQLAGSIPPALGSLTNLYFLSLHTNEFEGAVPNELSNLINLETLYLNSNLFDSIPDFSGISSLETLWVQENILEFDELEPHIGITNFFYSPQANVEGLDPISISVGEELSFTIPVGGSANNYQWYKDGFPVSDQLLDTFFIASASLVDAGNYYLTITNDLVSDLTLQSGNVMVDVTVGIGENINNIFKLYPNPSNGDFTLELDEDFSEFIVNIYSIDGRLVESIENQNTNLLKFTINQGSGVYFMELLVGEESSVVKLMVE